MNEGFRGNWAKHCKKIFKIYGKKKLVNATLTQ